MSNKIDELTEALAGVLSEQRALQAYTVDFINAYNKEEPDNMLRALKGALGLFDMFLKEYGGNPVIAEAVRGLDKVRANLDGRKLESLKNNRKRRR